MDRVHRDKVISNLHQLTERTLCSGPFLTIFLSRKVFSQADIQIIEALNVSHDKSKRFYDILQTRSNGYDVLIHALQETKQSGVLQILHEPLEPIISTTLNKPGRPFRFIEPIPFLNRFLKEIRKNTLVLSSDNCRITCERIKSVTRCAVLSLSLFDRLVSSQETLNFKTPLLVINCENKLTARFNYEKCKQVKSIFVTSQPREQVKKHLKGRKLKKIALETDSLRWEEISPVWQNKIKEKIEATFDLDAFSSDFSPILEKLDSSTLLQLMEGKTPELFQNNFPREIPYYIPRRLHCRNIVSNAIFDADEPDIYLFKNIERDALSLETKDNVTQTSRSLIYEKYNGANICRFVILDHPLHFRKIKEKFKERPVHLLRFENDVFIWEKSNGKMASIQKHVEGGQNEINEQEFVQHILSLRRQSKYPICISDTPGMGKTKLLTHMGRELQKNIGDGLVAFLVISDLIKNTKKRIDLLKQMGLPGQRSDEDVKEAGPALITILAKNQLGVIFLENRQEYLKELLLDGFDEVSAKDESFAYNCIKAIQSQFENTRIWITTRPHMFTDMENKFNVMGYNIKAFEQQDQIRFLKSYWSRHVTEGVCSMRMSDFAKACLKTVKSTFNQLEEDIAGIPLQCLLIGEVFEEDARTYVLSRIEQDTRKSFQWSPEMCNMLTLYDKLLENKLRKFDDNYNTKKLDHLVVKQAHCYMAISVIFPFFKKKFKQELCTSISSAELYNVGFLEPEISSQSPKFIHRTFAEYFLALFVVESIKTGCISKLVLDLLFENILDTEEIIFKINDVEASGRDFKYYVICYFIDAMLGSQPYLDLMTPQCFYSCCVGLLNKILLFRQTNCIKHTTFPQYKVGIFNENFSKIRETAEACAYRNLPNIFEQILNIDFKSKNVYTPKFLQLATYRSDPDMAGVAYQNYRNKSLQIKDIKVGPYTLLHLAVIRGDYGIVERLLNIEEIRSSIDIDQMAYDNLISECVINSKFNDKISDRKYIISRLAKTNKMLFNYDRESVLSRDISINLAAHIIKSVPHVYQNPGNVNLLTNIVHHFTDKCSSREYLNILKVVLSGCAKTFGKLILNTASTEGQSIIQKIVLGMDPDFELLNFLKISGHVFKRRPILLDIAIKNRRGKECLLFLLQNPLCTKNELARKLFYCVYQLNSQSLDTILKFSNLGPNIKNSQGDTMMHCLFRVKGDITLDHYKIADVLCQYGANLSALNKSYKTPIDILVNTRYSTYGRNIFDLLKNSGKLQISRINYFQCKWLLHNDDQIQEQLFQELFVKYVTEKGTVRERDFEKNTLLHLAALQGNFPAIQATFEAGSFLNSINRYTETPLHILASSSRFSIEAWNFLVKAGADVVALNKDNLTPICLLSSRNPGFSLEALTHALDILSSRDDLKSAQLLLITIWRYSLPIVVKMCEHYSTLNRTPIDQIKCKFMGKRITPFYMALVSKDVNVLEYVMVTLRCSKLFIPPPSSCIHTYLQLGNLESSIKFLRLVGKAFPHLLNVQNEQGEVPLSVRGINALLVRPLVSLGANINAVDNEGNTPLHRAIIHNQPSCHLLVKELIDNGANVNDINNTKETPLKLTLQILNKDDMVECIRFLVKGKADASVIDLSGNTFLHLLPSKIMKSNFHNIVEIFLDGGFANVFEVCNDKGETPVDIARKCLKPLEPRTVELLQNHGIFIRRPTN